MATKPLNICLVSSEFASLAKTGGLGDVSSALSSYLHSAGHDVRVLIPRYSRIDALGLEIDPVPALADMSVRLGNREVHFSIDRLTLESGLPVYLVRCPEFYGRDAIYTNDDDEHLRFALLSRAALEMCQRFGFAPDIMSCHDWQTSLIPLYLKSIYSWDELFSNTKSVLTIHNIGYQGQFGSWIMDHLSLNGAEHHLHQDDFKSGVINFLKTGVMYADLVTTVSPTYAREILGEDYGMGLNDLLWQRVDSVVGILNGVDYGEWDPATDPLIPANYSPKDMSGKRVCKERLMQEMGLEIVPERPLLGIVTRLAGQKGIELVDQVIPRILDCRDCAIVVLGSGEERYEHFFEWLSQRFPGRAAFYRGYNNDLAHWIEAGSDVFLMPSLYEPSGLNQMYSMKYGTVPVVRETGGLADSVDQIDPATGDGTGVVFRHYDAPGFEWAVSTALNYYANKDLWQKVIANGMAKDFSWDEQGSRYVELFDELRGAA
ncbi:MAG: glycogen synthase [Woeseiaceae bacterium]|nr:glycogen synthase [Woeseiaceae bacterium]